MLFSFFFFLFSFFFFLMFIFYFNYSCLVIDFYIPVSFMSDISLSFCVDLCSLCFFFTVSMICFIVFLYSKFYMFPLSDFHSVNKRFLFILFFFVSSMFFLVFSYSWVSVMFGWDGLGLVSFLLVVYYNDSVSLNSGLLTVFTNRVGDCFFILGFSLFMSLGFYYFDSLLLEFNPLMSLLLILGAITKSAQLPFSSWLPAAMAAPTPVSSLVHSSTLVVAGVYVLWRFSVLLQPGYFVLSIISLMTMFLSGLCAMVELDFKKVVAMSTLSQLGFMLYTLSCGFSLLCFLHMTFHAVFKSMLFFSTGSLMHNISGCQDSRFFGSMSDSFFSKIFFNVSCLSLSGFPFLLGFYSKDCIVSSMFFGGFSLMNLIFILSCCFTVSYSLRLIFLNSFCNPTFSPSLNLSESYIYYAPIIFLFLFCCFYGNFFLWSLMPLTLLSFFDVFLGILIMGSGVFIFFIFNVSYVLNSFLSHMSFSSLLFSSLLSFHMFFVPWKQDFSWGEILGGGGVSLVLSKASITMLSPITPHVVGGVVVLFCFFYTFFVFSPLGALALKGLVIMTMS